LVCARCRGNSEPPDVLYNRLVEIATGVAAAKGRLGFAPLLLPILGITPMDWQSAELALVWTKLKNLLDNGSKFATAGMLTAEWFCWDMGAASHHPGMIY